MVDKLSKQEIEFLKEYYYILPKKSDEEVKSEERNNKLEKLLSNERTTI
jgi:hypothetical protein